MDTGVRNGSRFPGRSPSSLVSPCKAGIVPSPPGEFAVPSSYGWRAGPRPGSRRDPRGRRHAMCVVEPVPYPQPMRASAPRQAEPVPARSESHTSVPDAENVEPMRPCELTRDSPVRSSVAAQAQQSWHPSPHPVRRRGSPSGEMWVPAGGTQSEIRVLYTSGVRTQ